MTLEQFADAITRLGWSQQAAGRQFGVSTYTIGQWSRGVAPVPPDIAEWLARTLRYLTRHPPPKV